MKTLRNTFIQGLVTIEKTKVSYSIARNMNGDQHLDLIYVVFRTILFKHSSFAYWFGFQPDFILSNLWLMQLVSIHKSCLLRYHQKSYFNDD